MGCGDKEFALLVRRNVFLNSGILCTRFVSNPRPRHSLSSARVDADRFRVVVVSLLFSSSSTLGLMSGIFSSPRCEGWRAETASNRIIKVTAKSLLMTFLDQASSPCVRFTRTRRRISRHSNTIKLIVSTNTTMGKVRIYVYLNRHHYLPATSSQRIQQLQ